MQKGKGPEVVPETNLKFNTRGQVGPRLVGKPARSSHQTDLVSFVTIAIASAYHEP